MPLSRLAFNAPELIVRGGEALGAGIANGGQNLGRGLEAMFAKRQAEKERIKRDGDLAASLRKTLKIAYPERGKEFDALGLPDLRGVLEGEALSSARRKEQEALKERAAMANFARSAAQPIVENYYEAPERFPQPPNVALATIKNPDAAGLPNFAAVAKALEAENMVPTNLSFNEDPVSGARFARTGNTVLPSGVNPSKITMVDVTDPNTGELVSLPVNPRTGQAILKPRAPVVNRVAPNFLSELALLRYQINPEPNNERERNNPKVLEKRIRDGREGIRSMIDDAHALKQLDDQQRDIMYGRYGITGAGTAYTAPSAPAAARVRVVAPDGKRYTLPEAQLEAAKQQGYKLLQ